MQPTETNMLDLAIQPPQYARPGVALFPPVAARLRSSTNRYDELSQMWALTTLVNHDGQVLDEHISGRTADSAHPMSQGGCGHGSSSRNSSRDQAYFYFPDLSINASGTYRIRVTLMRMDYSSVSPDGQGVAVAEDYVDSRSIVVDDGEANRARPSRFF